MNKTVNENQAGNSTTDYVDRLRKSVGGNRDTDGLGTMAAGPFVIGSVDAINGEDGKEVPELMATRHELKQLAEYWAQEGIEWRWSAYIDRRLNRLSEILGPEAMRKIHNAAIASFRKHRPKLTDEDWRVFTEGTQEEQEAWRTTVFREDEAAE
jgi:hypothetical protein